VLTGVVQLRVGFLELRLERRLRTLGLLQACRRLLQRPFRRFGGPLRLAELALGTLPCGAPLGLLRLSGLFAFVLVRLLV
jgi:hypothetical protein